MSTRSNTTIALKSSQQVSKFALAAGPGLVTWRPHGRLPWHQQPRSKSWHCELKLKPHSSGSHVGQQLNYAGTLSHDMTFHGLWNRANRIATIGKPRRTRATTTEVLARRDHIASWHAVSVGGECAAKNRLKQEMATLPKKMMLATTTRTPKTLGAQPGHVQHLRVRPQTKKH